MIKLGICTSPENLSLAVASGYEYIEFGLASISSLSDEAFEALAQEIDLSPIKAEAFNGMLPGTLRLTGENADLESVRDYLSKAFPRAKRLGAQVIVFGSGAARAIPEGFPTDKAWRQLADYLRLVETFAAQYDITVAIEPLCTKECNVFNFVSEAVLMASLLDLPHIKALGDTYHMVEGHEPFTALTLAGDTLRHVHTAKSTSRVYPKENDGDDYKLLFDTLKGIGYTGRVSVEGRCDNPENDFPAAFKILDKARQ